jgi:predicted nuclease of predicted toxin-antitoxin system
VKIKLDENLGAKIQDLFRASSHDVETVWQEKLSGADDTSVFTACCNEQRCLITLDLDFADPVRFNPKSCGGIIILRIPRHAGSTFIERLAREALFALAKLPFDKELWIVEIGRIRMHQFRENE